MKNNPLFSVVIPTLNEEKFLPHLLESLEQQTEKDFEVIVVDGSSKDKTVEKARTFTKKLPFLKVIISKTASLPLQRNLGAKEARAPWLLFVDADSVLMPYFFERIRQFVAAHQPEVFTSWFRPDSEIPGDALIALIGIMMTEGSLILNRPNITPGPFAAIKRDTFNAVGGYDERHVFNEDLDIGFRLYKHGAKFGVLRETIYVWSLRRLRSQGTLKVAQQYARAALQVLIFKRPLRYMSGYFMGGHLYSKKRVIRRSLIAVYEKKLRKLVGELFE
ncbi:glycosyltransferase [Patescibacteria group bacterium]|nr:glycosyltransferase [Patescibacteria group bacterium]MBU1472980.1 glycosyltransferase [Patescibacteria group bacterium]MBU2459672.1 glycosyltransferase [Patescibacteria group bacterium]MBU2544584.1 glycosyltransferase [Patescibacteria group bacterium]